MPLHSADLAEALGALAENGVRHARERVAIRCEPASGHVVIRVRDDGPGSVPDFLSKLPERGLRLDQQPNGNGLGLSIATDIAAGAYGSLSLHNLEPGFEAVLTLPSVRPAMSAEEGAKNGPP